MLVRRYPPSTAALSLKLGGAFDRSLSAMILYVAFGLTVIGWMTEPIHGVRSSIIGFAPVVVLLATKVFTVDDLRGLNWHILWLVGGGIALGNGVSSTGLDAWLVDRFDWGSMPTLVLMIAMAALALTLSTVISNSATANLLAPVGISLALSQAVDLNPLLAGVLIAMACSLAMALPVSTPPNAVAYASGTIESKDMAVVGLAIGLLGLLLVVFVMPPIWEGVGLL
jgi:sodium-dependent dicarboxylate transporter 2/3/5